MFVGASQSMFLSREILQTEVLPHRPLRDLYLVTTLLSTSTTLTSSSPLLSSELLAKSICSLLMGPAGTSSESLNVTVQCAHYDSIRGSSFIPTPSWLKKKRAVVNVLNENDDYCFLYSVLAHKYPR